MVAEFHSTVQRKALAASGLLLAVLVVYWPSFGVDFFLDDFAIIVENPSLHNVFNLAAIWDFSWPRFFSSVTLAGNYTIHGESVLGFHLVNFLVHLATGCSLFALVTALMRSPALVGRIQPWMVWVPMIATAIFLLHPLQTQAVTYIVQRFTSLAALFYLATMACYCYWRIQPSAKLLAATLVCMILALFCKQSAATLPLALVFLELVFFRKLSIRAWVSAVLAAVAIAVMIAVLVSLPPLDIIGLTRESGSIARLDYLATQAGVVWRYIGLFFLIGEQRLEYDIELVHGFLQPSVISFAIGHIAVLSLGLGLFRYAPLVSFGITFYYLALAVESSFFPISDLAVEHRTYLPNVGLAVLAALGLAWTLCRLRYLQIGLILLLLVLSTLAYSTHSRNMLWADRIEFLFAETRLSPNHQRAWTSLGKELMRIGRFRKALEVLEEAVEVGERQGEGHFDPPTLLNMVFALHYNDRNREAINLARQLPVERFNRVEKAFYHEAVGRSMLAEGNAISAIGHLTRSVETGGNVNALAFLAKAELELDRRSRARHLAQEVLRISPNHPLAKKIMRLTDTD